MVTFCATRRGRVETSQRVHEATSPLLDDREMNYSSFTLDYKYLQCARSRRGQKLAVGGDDRGASSFT